MDEGLQAQDTHAEGEGVMMEWEADGGMFGLLPDGVVLVVLGHLDTDAVKAVSLVCKRLRRCVLVGNSLLHKR